MPLIDTHCDTLTKLYNENGKLLKNTLHLDIKKMQKMNYSAQIFACFINPEFKENAFSYAKDAFSYFISELKENADYIRLAKTSKDYKTAKSQGKLSAFLSIEGGECIENLSSLDFFSELGVKMISLTWNYENKLATGVLGDSNKGLTKYGKNVILEMNKKKILLDVSHLNEKSFWEASELTTLPIVASHSNSRYVCDNARNLTDEQFRLIRKSNGYVGINLYPLFLTGTKEATIADVMKHIEHFLSLGGENIIGLGCDFDGVDFLPKGMKNIEDIEKLLTKFINSGYSQEFMDKITHKNFEKLINLF